MCAKFQGLLSSASPRVGPSRKELAMSPSSTVLFMAVSMIPNIYIYVIFDLLLHAAFVAHEIRGDMREPARA